MTPDEARVMPGAFTAYRRTDGEPVWGEYAWITEPLECGEYESDDATEYEEVVMVPVRVRLLPCHEQKVEEDNDAEAE